MITGAILLVPLFLIRYGLLAIFNKEALNRAAHFPPMAGNERIAYWIYQLSTVGIIVFLCFLKIQTNTPWFFPGLIVYTLGILLFVLATIDFAKPSDSGLNTKGLYRFSRNPMYVAYFVYFLGASTLTNSVVMLAILLAFQISAHWIIIAEERWCQKKFAEEYAHYRSKVRRYL